MRAPIETSILHNCCTYGSQAALYMVVCPLASTLAISIFAAKEVKGEIVIILSGNQELCNQHESQED